MELDFFWDPVCPFAWITSRWVEEVAAPRDLHVDWRFISLLIVNEERDYEADFRPGYRNGHLLGLRLLRVAAAARHEHGPEAIGPYYTAVGTRLHPQKAERTPLYETDGLADFLRPVLAEAGLPAELAETAEDEKYDGTIREDTSLALARAGNDLGTPIITFEPPDGPSFFGPVISRIPRGEEAVRLWDATHSLATLGGFAEIKRSLRERPVFT